MISTLPNTHRSHTQAHTDNIGMGVDRVNGKERHEAQRTKITLSILQAKPSNNKQTEQP